MAGYLTIFNGQLVDRRPAVLAQVLDAAFDTSVASSLKDKQAGLLADPDYEPILRSWSDLTCGHPTTERKGDSRSLAGWWATGDEEEFERIWPARTKSDLSIRRTRAKDIWFHCKRVKIDPTLYLHKLRGEFDYISALNITWGAILFGDVWFSRWQSVGAFDNGLTHYVTVTKWVSDRIKTETYLAEDRFMYIECASLAGYRNLPFPGFDLVKEAKEYAEGGNEHHLPAGWTFNHLRDEALAMEVPPVPWLNFDQYVAGAEWLTSGSSSIGYLKFKTADGIIHKVKARKNFVLDVVTPAELIKAANDQFGQQNRVLVKSELGKVRLAVAADIENFLIMSWINRMLGGAYKQWGGNTIEESVAEQNDRMLHMLQLCAKCYGLPFDYKGFEHQPTTEELKSIVSFLCEHARYNVPMDGRVDYDMRVNRMLAGFDMSTLILRDGNVTREWVVRGGLMSGMRWTSVIGNAWNSIMTLAVMKLLEQTQIPIEQIERYIRGDDSAIYCPSASHAILFAEGYKQIGVLGGEGKFSVRRHEMEFLRVWFSNRCNGYPARSLPGLVQRKPWSNAPWSEDMVLRALHEVCGTLSRRGVDSSEVWRSISSYWCQLHHLPKEVCSIPTSAGGFGLDPWDGCSYLSSHVPKVEKPAITPIETTQYRTLTISELAIREQISITPDQAEQVAMEQLSSVIAADDIPEVGRAYRHAWKDMIKVVRIRVHKRKRMLAPTLVERVPHVAVELGAMKRLDDWVTNRCGSFGMYRSEIGVLKTVKPLLAITGESISSWIRRTRPKISHLVSRGHIGEMLDWLGGTIPVPTFSLHPMLKSIASKYAAATILKTAANRDRRVETVFSLLAPGIEAELTNMPLIQKTMLW